MNTSPPKSSPAKALAKYAILFVLLVILVGQRVALTYEQHRGIPTSCFGETEYFITDVKVIAQPATP
ncbi:protein of unknown function [Georgfuchsia toluolica]|uniref:Uncharacterized protein n=1 Tax=Georgfuchsia toluolica TaxID=424218 RepID=A0A916N8W3_9PROT|nr:hypothetical protein [Georgfuchsia toluolica]CAG4883752.1 protein of unknown function [Georgfuchsia toluolica]